MHDYDEQIESDVSRTFPDDPNFSQGGEGSTKLSRMMHAFALYRRDIGYSQGMSVVGAVLLTVMRGDDDAAFWLLVQVFEKYHVAGLYCADEPLLGPVLEKYKGLVRRTLPLLQAHFDARGVTLDLYMVQWIRTLFAHLLPLPAVLRLWDVFLLEGIDFVLFVAVDILIQNETQLLLRNDPVAVMQYFKGSADALFTFQDSATLLKQYLALMRS